MVLNISFTPKQVSENETYISEADIVERLSRIIEERRRIL